jgi:hypothetical protein
MTPFEFFQWCVAGALGLLALSFALTVAVLLVKSALSARPRA